MDIYGQRRAVGQWINLHTRHLGRPPTDVDADHSSLLFRLLEGKEPLPQPPPRAYSYPWYSLVETGGPELCEAYPHFDDYMKMGHERPFAVVNQSLWKIVGKDGDTYLLEWYTRDTEFPWQAKLRPAANPMPLREWAIELVVGIGA